MKKFIILILFTVISCTPSEEDVQAIIDEAVENALETTTTTAPLTSITSTTTTAPLTSTTSTTTTTTAPLTTTTSTTTTIPPTNIEIKLPNETNQFP